MLQRLTHVFLYTLSTCDSAINAHSVLRWMSVGCGPSLAQQLFCSSYKQETRFSIDSIVLDVGGLANGGQAILYSSRSKHRLGKPFYCQAT